MGQEYQYWALDWGKDGFGMMKGTDYNGTIVQTLGEFKAIKVYETCRKHSNREYSLMAYNCTIWTKAVAW